MKLNLRLATPIHTLALLGGGEFSFGETREIDQIILSRMPPDRRSIAFLPTASGSAEYAVHLGKYLSALDPTVEVKNIPIYRGRDARRRKSLDAIAGAGMIYLGGGVTNNLLQTLRESPAEEALREAAAAGAIIVAIGAAASSFGIHARDLRGGALAGLGWLEGAVVETGFLAEDDVPLRRLMSLPDVRLGLGIPTRTAILVDANGDAEIAGSGQIAVFRKQ